MRHAYLIITHGSFEILEQQLRFLDSENADFYIHVDARVKGFDFDKFRSIPQASHVTFISRIPISWGHFSQIQCEMMLLRAAAPGHYDYYHLLSGVDVPVKSRAYIERFFREHGGVNYIHFQYPEICAAHLSRVKRYYPFQRWNNRGSVFPVLLRKISTGFQLLFGVDRTRKYPDFIFQKGANWFSITHPLVEYLLEREAQIYQIFHCTFCGDETFLHSMVMNSPFVSTLPPHAFDGRHQNCCRYIDWERGRPYCFRNGDFEELTQTGPMYLFARKFNYSTDREVVDKLFQYFGEGGPGAAALEAGPVPVVPAEKGGGRDL